MAAENDINEGPTYVPVQLTPARLAPGVPEALIVEGPVGSGKTARLVEHTTALLGDGAAPDDLLVLCATPDAAAAFAARLAVAHGLGARVRVTCPRALALEALGTPEARAHTGRGARLLDPIEEDVLEEDLKVTGLEPARLHQMLRFFRRALSELADDDAHWLVTDEEEGVFGLLQENLAFTGGVLEVEASALCLRFLMAHPEELERRGAKHVIVDDYQLISRASQVLACTLARQSVAIAFDPTSCLEALESYPYERGPAEFAQVNPQAKRVVLAAPKPGGRLELASATMANDVDACVRLAAERIGTGMPAGAICAVAPRPAWARALGRAFREAGVPCELSADDVAARGNFRTDIESAPARMLALVRLAADRNDGAAWRLWCGAGDPLARSLGMQQLRTHAAQQGMGFREALQAAAEGAIGDMGASLRAMADAYQAARDALARMEGLKGAALLHAAAEASGAASTPAAVHVQALCAPGPSESGPQDAAAMAARANRRLALPSFERPDAVRILPLERLAGMSPALMLMPAFVNGFYPANAYFDQTETSLDDQSSMDREARRDLAFATGKARETAFGWFEEIGLEDAEVLGVKIERIRAREGKRVCRTSPSIYLPDLLG